jgi:type I restriction enzyme S subunit
MRYSETEPLPEDWRRIPLGDVLERITYGFTNPMPSTVAGPFMVTAKDIRFGRIDYSSARHTSLLAYQNDLTDKSRPRLGDVLLTKDGSIGRVAICDREGICINQSVALLRPNELVRSDYLSYLLQAPGYQEKMERDSDGSTIKHIYITRVNKMLIALPTLREQEAIARVLTALDDKIATNIMLATKSSELATAIFDSVLAESTTVSRLADLVTTQYGLTTSARGGSGPRLVRVTDINKRPWIEWDSAPGCEVTDTEFERYRVASGDILVARMADPGKAGLVDLGHPDAVFASYLVRVRALDPNLALYVYYFLRSELYRNYSAGAMQGSVQKNMNARVIVATDIALPDQKRILQFNDSIRPLRALINGVLKENAHLVALRDTILPQLMSGNLRVREAEKTLETVL